MNSPQTDTNHSLEVLQHKVDILTRQLLQSEKLATLGQLAAGVAHEINNPIGYVASNLKMLTEYTQTLINMVQLLSARLEPMQRQALFEQYDFEFLCQDLPSLALESEEGLARVIEIIKDLKDFSHIDDAEFVLADLHQGIQSSLNIVSKEIKYSVELQLQLGELPPVECVPSQINQVVLNLLINAAHAIGEKGQIVISTGCQQDRVWLSVQDSGCGIPEEQQQLIFEPFFTTKPKGQGTGLGLALSRGIAEKHQGRLEVQSQPGLGSCFTLWLPVRQPQLPY